MSSTSTKWRNTTAQFKRNLMKARAKHNSVNAHAGVDCLTSRIDDTSNELNVSDSATPSEKVLSPRLPGSRQPASSVDSSRMSCDSSTSSTNDESDVTDSSLSPEPSSKRTCLSRSGQPSSSVKIMCDQDFMSDFDDDSDLEVNYLEEAEGLQLEQEPEQEPVHQPEDPANPDEEPEQEPIHQPEDQPDDSDDPDDPDDPEDPGSDNDGNLLSDEEGSSDDETFSFDKAALDGPVRIGRMRRKRDVLLLKLANALRDKRTYDSLVRDFRGFNLSIGRPGYLPECKKTLWNLIGRKDAGVTKWAYGPECLHFLGRYSRIQGPIVACPICHEAIPFRKVKWFISLSLKKQFKNFLALPGVGELLRYREWRVKGREDGVEDIVDGELYMELQRNGVIGPMDFTFCFNSDGFRKFKHHSLNVWGLLVRLNELPPNLRQRNLFLAGIWIDKAEPNMNTFLRPFVNQSNRLSQNGINWRPNGANEVNSKIIPLVCCVDAKARAIIMNQHQYNGEWGCYCCNHQGVFLDGSMKYPLLPFGNLPEAEDRTHDSITAAMEVGHFFEGQKGASEIMNLNHFNMASGNGMDDLHPFYEGVSKFYFGLLVSDVLRGNARQALRAMNLRMSEVRTPTQMSRKWDSIHNAEKWKGSQWGYFVRYFIVLLTLENSLPQEHFEHLSMLSYSLFVLSQDSILQEEFVRVENYLERFLLYFQNNFGAGNMRFNIHMLKHVVRSRRLLGPAWTISTFNFESWNMVIGSLVTAANGAMEQIVIRHMMRSYVNAGVYRDDVPEDVKNYVNSILFGSPRVIAEEVNRDTVVLGYPSEVVLAEEEAALLTIRGFENVNRITRFDRVLVRGIEFRCSTYHPDTKSDNSVVKTWAGDILTINKIVVFDHEQRRICGLFVNLHETNYPIRYAHHVAHLTGVDRQDFVLANTLRVPAIKFEIRENSYVVPMANCREID